MEKFDYTPFNPILEIKTVAKEEVTDRTGCLPAREAFIVHQSHIHRVIIAVLKCFIAGVIVQ